MTEPEGGDAEGIRRRVADAERAVAEAPSSAAAHVQLAEACEELARHRRRGAAAAGPDVAGSIHVAVEVLGLRRRAAAGWKEAARLEPADAGPHTGHARALGRLAASLTAAGMPAEEVLEAEQAAVDAYAEAFRVAPGDADARTARGALLSALGVAAQREGEHERALARYQEAYDELQTARRLAPTKPAAVSESGWVLARGGGAQLALGRPGEAIASLESAIATFAEVRRLAPRNSFGPLSQGQAYTALADIVAANPPPASPSAPGRPASLDRAIGGYRQAIACYDTALQLDPGSIVITAARAETLQGLAELLALASRPRDALAVYREALAIYDGPLAGNAQSFQHQLGRGRCLLRVGELSAEIGEGEGARRSLEAARDELARDVPIDAAALAMRTELLERAGRRLAGEPEDPGPAAQPS